MTTYRPRTFPTPPVSPVEVVVNRLGLALVQWSLRHAERRAARAVAARGRAFRLATGTAGVGRTSTTTDLTMAEVTRRW